MPAGVPAAGVIGHNDSGDCFRVSAGAGALAAQVEVTTAWAGYASHSRANLDTKLSLLSSTGAVLATSNPTGTGNPQVQLASSISYTLGAAGTYYLLVQKAGVAGASGRVTGLLPRWRLAGWRTRARVLQAAALLMSAHCALHTSA